MGLYTIVCDYSGGTFVSQVHAYDERDAVKRWAGLLKDQRTLGDVSEQMAEGALTDDCEPATLDGLSGVWCWTALVEDALALLNIIRTAD